jgi:thiamine pyrophosphokinase
MDNALSSHITASRWWGAGRSAGACWPGAGAGAGLVAADGGADRALALGHVPQAVIGDMDSLSDGAPATLADRLHPVAEQETTDFDKALRMIRRLSCWAGLCRGAGGPRAGGAERAGAPPGPALPDPVGAGCHLSGRRPGAAPAGGDAAVAVSDGAGQRAVAGLRWPIDGLRFRRTGDDRHLERGGAPQVTLALRRARMLVILPRARLDAALGARGAAAPPVRGG